MTEQERIIIEHTGLVKEYANLPRNPDSPEEIKRIELRKKAIRKRIKVLKNIEKDWST